MRQTVLVYLCLTLGLGIARAQESRGTIAGNVTDPGSAAVAGATVLVTNTETNLVSRSATNDTGYFVVSLLNPGSYSVSVEAPGFKRSVREGLQLNVGGRLELLFQLEIGALTEAITVKAEAAMLDTASASSGRVVDRRQLVELPFQDLNPFTLQALAAGMQWTGDPINLKPYDNAGVSGFNTMGSVGQNEYTIDGAPVTGTNRRVGFVPPADAVEEFKLETAPFDAAYGHSSGAVVNVMTRAGTNAYHGSLYDQHWQQRWNAMSHFSRLAYQDQVRQGKKKASDPGQDPGRSNNFGATFGGPVRIPKLYNGQDKFFFFFSHNGIYAKRAQNPDLNNFTVPRMAWRQGDFSDLLALDSTKYTVYDPRSARLTSGRVVRTPFPANKGIPLLDPAYDFYVKTYPQPNDVPGLVSPEGFNNFYAFGTTAQAAFNSLINRYDYNLTERHRLSARWFWNHRLSTGGDWTYSTRPGLYNAGTTRINKGVGGDYVYILSTATVLNLAASWTRFDDGAIRPNQTRYKPTDVGLPAYLDAKAGDYHTLPRMAFSSLAAIGDVYPTIGSKGATAELKLALNTIRGQHALKYGWQERRYWFASSGPGYSSGVFSFNNNFMRAADNTTTASNQGLEWAAFMMGLPSTVSIDTNDSGYFSTRFRAFYFQDDWRASSKLHFNLGLRYEREGGMTERFNRGLSGEFLYDAKLPFSDAVQAAYARSPLPEVPAARFAVLGGTAYLGKGHNTFNDGTHHVLPRFGVAYQVSEKTVLRGGYGWYYDTFNVNNSRPSQYGYSQPTNTTITNDVGLTLCCGVGAVSNLGAGRNPMADPFPVRADGSRFDAPYGSVLGLVAMAGRGLTFTARDFSPAFQQRWRFGVQREIRGTMVLEVSYNGAWARIPVNQRVDYLPQQYWATGNARNQAADDLMNQNVTSPFYIGNLAALQSADPVLYKYLSTQSLFTSRTIRENQLLRAFPQMNGLYGVRPGESFAHARGGNRYHDLQVQFEKRFSHGLHSAVMYTRAYARTEDNYYNEFDAAPAWRTNNDVRPHRFVWSAIYELPFGKEQRWLKSGVLRALAGGWQLSWVYQRQSGPATSWANRFYYGDLGQIGKLLNHDAAHARDLHTWFEPGIVYTGSGAVPQGFQGFEGRAAMQPGTYHARVFPTLLDDLRTDGYRTWNVKMLRRFAVTEQLRVSFSVDALNATNRTNFGPPNTNPTDRNFGKVTAQYGLSRVLQVNLRVEF